MALTNIRPVADVQLNPGSLEIEKRRLVVGCGANSAVEVFELQPAGKKRMTAEAFVNGYRPENGELFLNAGQTENYR